LGGGEWGDGSEQGESTVGTLLDLAAENGSILRYAYLLLAGVYDMDRFV
jgi:hypothetical protein